MRVLAESREALQSCRTDSIEIAVNLAKDHQTGPDPSWCMRLSDMAPLHVTLSSLLGMLENSGDEDVRVKVDSVLKRLHSLFGARTRY